MGENDRGAGLRVSEPAPLSSLALDYGAGGGRTRDLLNALQARSQLRHSPNTLTIAGRSSPVNGASRGFSEPLPPTPSPLRGGGAEGLAPSPLRGGGWRCGSQRLTAGTKTSAAMPDLNTPC